MCLNLLGDFSKTIITRFGSLSRMYRKEKTPGAEKKRKRKVESILYIDACLEEKIIFVTNGRAAAAARSH